MTTQEPGPVEILLYILVAVPAIATIALILYSHTLMIKGFELDQVELVMADFVENIVQHNLVFDRAVFDSEELKKYDGTGAQPYVNHSRYKYYLEVYKPCDSSDQCDSFCMAACDMTEAEVVLEPTNKGRLQLGNCGCIRERCACEKDEYVRQWAFGYSGPGSSTIGSFPTAIKYEDSVVPVYLTIKLYDTKVDA